MLVKALGADDDDGAPMFLVYHDDNLPFYKMTGYEAKCRFNGTPKKMLIYLRLLRTD